MQGRAVDLIALSDEVFRNAATNGDTELVKHCLSAPTSHKRSKRC